MITDLLSVLQATETVWRPGNEATCIKSLYSENPAITFSFDEDSNKLVQDM